MSRELKGPEVSREGINGFQGSLGPHPGALGNTFMLSLERGLNQGWRRARAGNVGVSKTFSCKRSPKWFLLSPLSELMHLVKNSVCKECASPCTKLGLQWWAGQI